MKVYITFGQCHRHNVNGVLYDKNCVAVFDCESLKQGHKLAAKYFNNLFHKSLEEPPEMEYFPRGLLHVDWIVMGRVKEELVMPEQEKIWAIEEAVKVYQETYKFEDFAKALLDSKLGQEVVQGLVATVLVRTAQAGVEELAALRTSDNKIERAIATIAREIDVEE